MWFPLRLNVKFQLLRRKISILISLLLIYWLFICLVLNEKPKIFLFQCHEHWAWNLNLWCSWCQSWQSLPCKASSTFLEHSTEEIRCIYIDMAYSSQTRNPSICQDSSLWQARQSPVHWLRHLPNIRALIDYHSRFKENFSTYHKTC